MAIAWDRRRSRAEDTEPESSPKGVVPPITRVGIGLGAAGAVGALSIAAAPLWNRELASLPVAVAGIALLATGAGSYLIARRQGFAEERHRASLAKLKAAAAHQRRRESLLIALMEVQRLLLADQGGDGYGETLEPLGIAGGAGRVFLYRLYDSDGPSEARVELRAEWCAAGIPALIDSPGMRDYALHTHFPSWLEKLYSGRPVHDLASAFPADERHLLGLQSVQTLLVLPIMVGDRLWGCIGFENRTAALRWSTDEVALLITGAEAIAHAQMRRDTQHNTLQQAHHDALTGLPNRRHLRERLEEFLGEAARHRTSLAVLYCDLDRFKQINDTLGHAFGDRFLQYVVRRRLTPCIGRKDLLARVGGDEFVLVMAEIDDADIVTGAAKMAGALLKSLTEPILMEGQELVISASIGISRFPVDGADADTLLKHADVAMYRSKEEGRGDYRFFTSQMNRATTERFELEADLRHDLNEHRVKEETFTLFFQPQVDVVARRMIGVESLVRWRHPKRGMISPTRFIPIAEETGLIKDLSQWVLAAASQQAALWSTQGCPLRVAVNLSAQQMRGRELIQQVASVLETTHLAPALLDLELTETAVLQDMNTALEVMRELKNMGVCLSLDDFGAGYQSLSHLRHCPFDVVKIDRSFVKAIVGSVRDQMVVKHLVALAHDLGMTVVAEGVETEAQRDILLKLGCHHFQGFLFSTPISAEDLERLFLRHALKGR